MKSDGFVKIIADKETNDILGVHMIGPHVTDLISEAGLAKVLDATPWEIAQTIHPHPSLSEVMGEAALAVDGKAIPNTLSYKLGGMSNDNKSSYE